MILGIVPVKGGGDSWPKPRALPCGTAAGSCLSHQHTGLGLGFSASGLGRRKLWDSEHKFLERSRI